MLVVSTDPAHNLSDAFGQKFGREPVKVNGFDNLFCMEVDSSGDQEWEALEAAQVAQGVASDGLESGVGSIMKDLMTSVPGIDEAMAFAELMKMVQEMNYSTIVFDTAPTGHTLRLLSFPKTMESAIGKLLELKVRLIATSVKLCYRLITFLQPTESFRRTPHTSDSIHGGWRRRERGSNDRQARAVEGINRSSAQPD